ncbi:MAG: hypothetical protein R3C59_25890 [Planctomycetaceae bacterium]
MLSRFAMSAWVGAAALFVVTTLREVHSPQLDSATKSELAVLRFPGYYMFAFSLVAAALVFGLCASPAVSKFRRRTTLSLVGIVLVLTAIDYEWVYGPLAHMTAAVEEARPASFVNYHRASKWLNTAQVSLSAIAALLMCWPVTAGDERTTAAAPEP